MNDKKTIMVVKGTKVFSTVGSFYLSNDLSNKTSIQNFEKRLDNQEWSIDTIFKTENGLLCLYFSVGDEQPSCELIILDNWSVETIEEEIPVKPTDEIDFLFSKYTKEKGKKFLPKFLKELLLLEGDHRKKINPFSCFGRKPHPMDFGNDPEEFEGRLNSYNAWEKNNQ